MDTQCTDGRIEPAAAPAARAEGPRGRSALSVVLFLVGGLMVYAAPVYIFSVANQAQEPMSTGYMQLALALKPTISAAASRYAEAQGALPIPGQRTYQSTQGEVVRHLIGTYNSTLDLFASGSSLIAYVALMERDLLQQQAAGIQRAKDQTNTLEALQTELAQTMTCTMEVKRRAKTLAAGFKATSTSQEIASALVQSAADITERVKGIDMASSCLGHFGSANTHLDALVALHDDGVREFNAIASRQGQYLQILTVVGTILLWANGRQTLFWLTATLRRTRKSMAKKMKSKV